MELDGLPEKPAGEAKVKFTFSIDINGELIIEKMSLDTGKKVLFQKNADWLIK